MCFVWQGWVAMDTVYADGTGLMNMGDCTDNDTGANNDISSDYNNHFLNNASPSTPSHPWSIVIALNNLYFIERKLSTAGVHVKKKKDDPISVSL